VPGLRGLVERTPVRGLLELHRVHDVFRRTNRSDKVFIAAINGPATRRRVRARPCCDLRSMADDDSLSIGLPEMTIGLPPVPAVVRGWRALSGPRARWR
jgi:enoyl-CoA hydratase